MAYAGAHRTDGSAERLSEAQSPRTNSCPWSQRQHSLTATIRQRDAGEAIAAVKGATVVEAIPIRRRFRRGNRVLTSTFRRSRLAALVFPNRLLQTSRHYFTNALIGNALALSALATDSATPMGASRRKVRAVDEQSALVRNACVVVARQHDQVDERDVFFRG